MTVLAQDLKFQRPWLVLAVVGTEVLAGLEVVGTEALAFQRPYFVVAVASGWN